MAIVVTGKGELGIHHEHGNPWRAWVVVFSATLFFFYEFMILNMFNAINASLLKDFQITAVELGQLSAYYFYANLLFLFPAGIILDRFSTKRLISTAMALSVAATFIFSMTDSLLVAKLCRFVMGAGGSFCLLGCVRLASRWFPPQRMALVVGLIVTFAMIGGMVSQTPMTLLTEAFGWRKTLEFTAAAGVLMLVAILTFVRDFPKTSQQTREQEAQARATELSFGQSLKLSLGNAQNWLAGFYTSMMNLPIFLLGAMWGTMYLQQLHHISRTHASWVTSMIFFGTVIGSPLLGWLSDHLGLRRLPMLVCALISLVIILLLMFVSDLSLSTLIVMFFALGFFTSAQVIGYPLVAESNPSAITGTATGIASTLIMAGGISQPVFGWLMGLHWNHHLIQGVPVYAASDYQEAMAMIPIAFVLAFVAAFIIKETYCVARD